MENIDKRIIIFDLDNTLTESRSPLAEETAGLLCELLDNFKVAVISGASFAQFEVQFINWLTCIEKFENLFILPTTGAELYRFGNGSWKQEYTIHFSDIKKKNILKESADVIHVTETKLMNFIEDRGTQITYSALGANAPIMDKKSYDPDRSKRFALIEKLKPRLQGINMAIGGRTSIDFTEAGIDKAYGISKMLKNTGYTIKDALFIGDALVPEGNDESVKSLGVSTMPTTGPAETDRLIRRLLGRNPNI